MTAEADEFWTFSLRVYKAPGVEKACLELQDKHGFDVNVVLFCCWAGSLGVLLSDQELEAIIAETGQWQTQVVKPLRTVRQNLKHAAEGDAEKHALRQTIKKAELAAEKIQQHSLARLLTGKDDGRSETRSDEKNLAAYARVMDRESDVDHLTSVIVAAV